jgi:phosphatidylserine/phosphatidylglycerophosphate/cardiolipin synthase-like enzyme/uncharacterized membrane protein YdjX (TVP38/TMEM64 family)
MEPRQEFPERRRAILQPGRNCWRLEQADRVAFLVDGEAYFGAVRRAMEQARHAVYILGWDIDSRILLKGNGERDGYPAYLGPFLNELVNRRKELHIYVLVWDFAMIYALEREWLPIYKLGWKSHRRVHFRMDNRHPPGGSQHQKVVAIDDQLAFLGGMDLAKWRWDTNAHHPVDPRRFGPEGHLYPPYHDVQALVSGAAAKAMGELARERWWRLTGRPLAPPPAVDPIWPENVVPDMEDHRVAFSRTFPPYNGWQEVREVERLFTDSIRAARRTIYVENQYFTSAHIGALLAERLADPEGPEIVLVLPKRSSGWLEQQTMDVLRARTLERLHAADLHRRLAVFYPDHPDVQPDYINVHDKVMIIDDEFARVGSANLSNRSMGLDSECDLALEANGDPMAAAAVAGLRNRLLAEHLETQPAIVDQVFRREGSLIRAIAALRRPGRSLIELPQPDHLEFITAPADVELVDSERPIAAQLLIEHLVEDHERRPAQRRLLINIALIATLVALAAAWRWTPLRHWLHPDTLFATLDTVRALPLAPLLVLALFVAGGLVVVPLTLMIVVTVLSFGPLFGFIYAYLGSLLSAFTTYGIGEWLGRDTVRRFAGRRVNQLSQRLAERGVVAMLVVRVLPVAPFSIVNVVAGASHIRFRHFVIGTALGLLPGLVAITLFVDRVAESLRHPQPANFILLGAVTAVLALSAWLLQRLLRKRRERIAEDMPRE